MRWLAAVLLTATVATCGQKGPLTRPDDGIRAAATPATTGSYGVRP